LHPNLRVVVLLNRKFLEAAEVRATSKKLAFRVESNLLIPQMKQRILLRSS